MGNTMWFNKHISATAQYIQDALDAMENQGHRIPHREDFDVYADNCERIVFHAGNSIYPEDRWHDQYKLSMPATLLGTETGWNIWQERINVVLTQVCPKV